MHKKWVCGVVLLTLMATLLAGCGAQDSPAPTPSTAAFPTPLPFATPSPTSSSPEAAGPCGPRLEITKVVETPVSPQPADMQLQLTWEGGFTRVELSLAGSRISEFTLLADGRVFYMAQGEPTTLDQPQLLAAQLTPAEAQELVQRVLDLGFERLESYTDQCRAEPDGSCLCVADAGKSVLRLRLASGELREVINYFNFANDPDALTAIRTLLEAYQHPQATPYVPEKAALVVQAVEAPAGGEVTAALDWPLDPAVLAPAAATSAAYTAPCQGVLSGSDLTTLLSVTKWNAGDFFFRAGDRVYTVYLAPWLPGVDYSDLVASSGQACSPAEALVSPLPTPVPLPGMPQPGATLTRPMTKDEMAMRYIPAGPFYMGSPEGLGESIEHPQHVVTLNAFWIDETEVTPWHYQTCIDAGVCAVPSEGYKAMTNKPVAVTWSAAETYCRWVGGRLPTEAEWEKAARGSDARTYPWGDEQPDCSRANYASLEGPCSVGPADAGSYPAGASPYGVLDMAGNVAEWVGDWFDPDYYAVSPAENPPGPPSGQARVARGGSWEDAFSMIRTAYRVGYIPEETTLSFRCVVPAAAYRVDESDRYENWYRYTNLDYGFSFHYPPDWTLQEKLHELTLRHQVTDTLVFRVVYQRADEDRWVVRTGMPAGDFVPRGSVPFLGQEISRDVLVFEGKAKVVLYNYSSAQKRNDIVFDFFLDDFRDDYELVDLPEDIQSQIDQVVSSFELTEIR